MKGKKRISPDLPIPQLYKSIIEAIDLGILFVDRGDTILFVNPNFATLLGYEPPEMIGKKANQLLLGKTKKKQIKLMKVKRDERKKGAKDEYELEVKHKSGKAILLNILGSPVRDEKGKIIGSLGVQSDISRLKEYQSMLEQALSDRTKLISNIREAFFSVDVKKGRRQFLSKAWEDIYGYSLAEFRSNFDLWFEVILPEDKPIVEASMARLALGEKVYHEYRIKRKDGKVIWLEGKVTPSLDKHGKLIRLDGVVADISRRKKAERQLNDKVNDLNTFIYKASHDLGAPLASMMGLIHLAEQENRNTEVKEYLGLVKVSLDKMTNLLKDLVSTASISQDKLTVEEIEFRPIVSQIHNAIKYSEEFSGIKFTTDIPEATGFRTDKRFLYPILSNLIMNAMKYRKNGKESYIRIGIREDVKGVVIQVKDNGVGIQGEIQDKIFNMFFRGTQSSKGSGLGLYIVKTAVEKLQGKITVESELRVGTTFTVFLPSLHVPAENHPLPRAADKISKVSLKTFSGLSD